MIFREVIEQGSFTLAAKKLNLTKSGVSQHVSRLEKFLGAQLLIRSTRSLSLTGVGTKLYERSNELNTLLNITIDEVNNTRQQPIGGLSITAPQALVPSAVLPAIQQLVKQFPMIKPRLIIDDGMQDIIKRGIDIAIRVGDLDDSELKARKIGEQTDILIASSAYISSLEKPITKKNIYEHPFIATSWQSTKNAYCFQDKNNMLSDELNLQSAFEVNSANTAIELVLLDLGVALLPRIYVNRFIREGKIQQVLSNLETYSYNIYSIHAYKQNVPLKVKWFLEFLMKQL